MEIRGQLSALQSSLSDLNQKIGPVSLHHHLWTRSILLDKDGDSEKIRCVDGGLVGTDSLITVPNTFNILEAYRRATLLDWPHKKHKLVFMLCFFLCSCLLLFAVVYYFVCSVPTDGQRLQPWLQLGSTRIQSQIQVLVSRQCVYHCFVIVHVSCSFLLS